MDSLISQFTPYTCTLDCWAHFMRERGNSITTEEILRHHRDLCWGAPHANEYGAIDKPRFTLLVRRYLMQSASFVPIDAAEIAAKLELRRGIFVFADNFHGNRHVLRVVGVLADRVQLLVPALPYGREEEATIDQIRAGWTGEFYEVQ